MRAASLKPDKIIKAALTIFVRDGFSSARMEDIATEAGVGKGTLYLYFKSKESLLEAITESAMVPVLDRVEQLVRSHCGPTEELLRIIVKSLKREMLQGNRGLIVRLMITEMHRFPEVTAMYYQLVVARGLKLLRGICRRAVARGDFADDSLARFPQMLVAPIIVAVVWQALFERSASLDVDGLIEANLTLLLRGSVSGSRAGSKPRRPAKPKAPKNYERHSKTS